MQDIHNIREFRHVDDPKGAAGIPYPNLPHTRPDRGHRLPVVGIQALLHLVELVPCFLPREHRKGTQIIKGAAQEFNRLPITEHS